MARNRKAITLFDADDGGKTDGMYRSGGAQDDHSLAEYRELFHEFNLPALERLKSIRAWLTTAIETYIDGPHDPQTVLPGGELGWFENLTLTAGTGIYRINADRRTWVENCVDALRENRQLEQILIEGGNLDLIVRLSVRQGQLMQRIQDRAIFSAFVRIGKRKSYKSREQAERTNQKRAASRPNYLELVKSVMAKRKIKYTPACRHVADQLKVTLETVRSNTKELWPSRQQK